MIMDTRPALPPSAGSSPQPGGARSIHLPLRLALVALLALTAFTAIWGAIFVVPTIPLAWLHQGIIAPFADTTIPALALGIVCGGSALVALATVLARPRVGALAALEAGVFMIGFELVEIAVVGFTALAQPSQPVAWLQVCYLLVGAATAGLALRLWKAEMGSYRLQWQIGRRLMTTTTDAPRMATWLTLLILVLLPVAALVGLLVTGFYRDAAPMIPQARGQDVVTLVVAEPLLLLGLLAWRCGSVRGLLLWAGTLGYVLYTYALYSYTAYFNALFLVYVAVFSAALFALVDLLAHIDPARIVRAVNPGMPRRVVAVFLALEGAFFLMAWLGQIVPATLHGTIPPSIVEAKTPSNGVFVQDLGVVIPLLFATAIWLWQRRPWGVIAGAALLIISDIILLALVSMSLFMARAHIAGALDLLWLWVVLTLVSLGLTGLFAGHLHASASLPREGRTSEATGEPAVGSHP